jgi:NADPH-dependent curcumin reductase CurA
MCRDGDDVGVGGASGGTGLCCCRLSLPRCRHVVGRVEMVMVMLQEVMVKAVVVVINKNLVNIYR